MTRTWLPILLLLSAALAGCAGDDPADAPDDEGGPLADGNQTIAAPGPVPVVTITNISTNVVAGDTLAVTWTVDAGGNGSYTLNETFLVWDEASVANPDNATAYGNQSDAIRGGDATASFNGTFAAPAHETVIYVRAYALVEDVATFSDESVVEVTPAVPDVTVHTVTIGSVGTGPVADYDPPVLQISAGEAVVWQNDDSAGHTATDRDGAWDTGTIGGGDASELILFETAGTYAYECGIHATMAGGVIEVS